MQELILEKRPWFQDASAESGLSIRTLHDAVLWRIKISQNLGTLGTKMSGEIAKKIYASNFLFHILNNLKKMQTVHGTHSDRRWDTGAAFHSS